jgi:Lrp/AsnC family transcriptional regulator, leucine-responsive regulatory protein
VTGEIMTFSDRDKEAILEIQRNARIKGTDLAQKCSHTKPGITRLFKKLEQDGFVKRYTMEIDHAKFGFNCLAFMRVKLRNQDKESAQALSQILRKNDKILEMHKIFGAWDFLIKIRTKKNSDIQSLAEEISSHSELVANVNTEIVSDTLLEEISVPAVTLLNFVSQDKNQ